MPQELLDTLVALDALVAPVLLALLVTPDTLEKQEILDLLGTLVAQDERVPQVALELLVALDALVALDSLVALVLLD